MSHLLDHEMLSADDVLMVPELGELSSSTLAELEPFIYSAPMDRVTGYELTKAMVAAGEYPVVSRDLPEAEYLRCLQEFAGHPKVFFAVSIKKKWLAQFFRRLESTGFNGKINLAVDVAHGDLWVAHSATRFLREQQFVDKIMSGSVATPGGALRAVQAGATHIRIGVGPGSQCTTRIVTGFGVPQLSAVYQINKLLSETAEVDGVPRSIYGRDRIVLIADGGIRSSGDAAKYLAAGADAIMMGSEFSKAKESPGWYHAGFEPVDTAEVVTFPLPEPNPIFKKIYRGCASAQHQLDHKGAARAAPEGESSKEFKWQGETVESVISRYRQGIERAISYGGGKSISDLNPTQIKMIKITGAAQRESVAHGNL